MESSLFLGVQKLKHIMVTLKVPKRKTAEFAKDVDPNEVAHSEPPHKCLPFLLLVLDSQYSIAWMKHFFFNFADIDFVVCFLWRSFQV